MKTSAFLKGVTIFAVVMCVLFFANLLLGIGMGLISLCFSLVGGLLNLVFSKTGMILLLVGLAFYWGTCHRKKVYYIH